MTFLAKHHQQHLVYPGGDCYHRERNNLSWEEADEDDPEDEKGTDDFDFKYVPANRFKTIVKNAERQRLKLEEDRVWMSFLKQQDQHRKKPSSSSTPSIPGDWSRREAPNLPDLDTEFLKLEKDSLPETTKKEQGNSIPRSSKSLMVVSSEEKRIEEGVSSGETTVRRLEDEPGPNPATTRKILTIQRKISQVLDEISVRLTEIPIPDDERDLERRRRRVVEFAVRFSRNYLYELGRQIAEIRHQLQVMLHSEAAKMRQLRVRCIERKLLAVHRLLLHALTAYCKHIPNTACSGHPDEKLKETLDLVLDLKGICVELQADRSCFAFGDTDLSPLVKETKDRWDEILTKLRAVSDNESRMISQQTTNRTSKMHLSKRHSASRFGMYTYNMDSGKPPRSRAPKPAKLSAGNRQIVSRRTKGGKILEIPRQPDPSPVSERGSSLGTLVPNDTARKESLRHEDDVKTVMDSFAFESDLASNPDRGSKRPEVHRDKLNPKGHSCTSISSQSETVDERLSCLVPVIADLVSLVNGRKRDCEVRALSSTAIESLIDFVEKYRKNSRRTVRKISREFVEPEGSSSKDTRLNNKCDSKTTKVDDSTSLRRILTCNGFSKRPPAIQEILVSDSAVAQLTQYQYAYSQYSRSNAMYSSNTRNKPWDVVAWISDKLVEELIVDISKELQMDNIIKRLFDMEFQDF